MINGGSSIACIHLQVDLGWCRGSPSSQETSKEGPTNQLDCRGDLRGLVKSQWYIDTGFLTSRSCRIWRDPEFIDDFVSKTQGRDMFSWSASVFHGFQSLSRPLFSMIRPGVETCRDGLPSKNQTIWFQGITIRSITPISCPRKILRYMLYNS